MILPQPATGLIAALLVLGLLIFILPPAGRVGVALLVIVIALAARGKRAAGIIDNLRRTIYGQ